MSVVGLIGVAVIIGIGAAWLVWWLIFETEGVYLGRRVVAWLYDVYADRYDGIKQWEPLYEHVLLANPIMAQIAPHKSPLVLDVATGTGRIPMALFQHPAFQGRIIGLDLSRKMLTKAAEKLHSYDRLSLIWETAEQLPFTDNTFDVVTCLEALEFMPRPAQIVAEMVRVLRPGGILLVSNRASRWMPGKIWSDDQLLQLLASLGVEYSEVEVWQEDYKKVWGQKNGESSPVGARPLEEVLRCQRCKRCLMTRDGDVWKCDCGARANIGTDGVIELFTLH